MTSLKSLENLIQLTPISLQNLLRSKPLLLSSEHLAANALKLGFKVLPKRLKSASKKDIIDYFKHEV